MTRLPRECRRDVRMGGLPKRTYGTKVEAEEHVGKGENAYQCGTCGFWHVGHKPGTKYGDKPGGRRISRA